MREGVILAQLYDEAKGNNKDLMQKYFLTAICHGDVRSDPDIFDDTELGLMRRLNTTDRFSVLELRNVLNSPTGTSSKSPYGTEL